MSTDWSVICDSCETYRHLGQDSGGIPSFGLGSKDEEGRKVVAEFVSEHMGGYCGDPAEGTDKPLRILNFNKWSMMPEYESYRDLEENE